MKQIFLAFVIILLFFNIVLAQEDIQNSQNLIINIDVSSQATIKPKSSDYSIKYINVNLSHYPYESLNLEVLDFKTTPDAEIKDNTLLYTWDNPKNKISFGYNTKIKTNSNIVKIKKKIQFPLLEIPSELEPYIKPSEIIDSNDEDIILLTSKLIAGEDDLYIVIHKIAEWTKNNIEYNLSTLTAEVSQKASWVLTNKQGVCDELTSLFIAMLRSVGVPAKFVSGIAYTDSELFEENWGSHGWAEVYFPVYGWIPYDVTYGQFGFIDPTHIKLKESIDSNDPSVQYRWLARNIDLETEKLDINTELEDSIGLTQSPVSLDIKLLKENIGFGSYNLIEVILENKADYYISSEVYISKPKELELTESQSKNILLKPKEKKSIFWTVKLTKNLQNNFIYTFPVTIITSSNATITAEIKSTKNDLVYSLNEVTAILGQINEEDKKSYSKEVSIDCSIDKKEFYAYENALLKCKVKNLGNIFLGNLNFCLKKECKKFNLGISQEKNYNFSIKGLKEGKQQLILSLKSKDVSKADYIDVDVLDKPQVRAQNITSPDEVSFNDGLKIGFLIKKASISNPYNVEITLSQKNLEKTWIVKELFEDQKFIINLLGRDLRKGNNEFNIIVKHKDKNGKSYETKEAFNIQLVNVTIFQEVLLTMNIFVSGLENLSPQSLMLAAIGSFIIFILVLTFVFKKRR